MIVVIPASLEEEITTLPEEFPEALIIHSGQPMLQINGALVKPTNTPASDLPAYWIQPLGTPGVIRGLIGNVRFSLAPSTESTPWALSLTREGQEDVDKRLLAFDPQYTLPEPV